MITLKVSLFTQLLRDVGYARMEVTGCSMLPAILPGDVIRVESGPVRTGDIVVFNRNGHLCAHRLLAIIDDQAIARGDANRKFDPAFPAAEILGRVTSADRKGSLVTDLAFRPLSSLLIRNSSIIRRVYLKSLALRSRIAGSRQGFSPTSTKSEA